jgi:hypothetical protein
MEVADDPVGVPVGLGLYVCICCVSNPFLRVNILVILSIFKD